MNILILTSIYPQEDDEENVGVTPVVKYFAREWIKAGHNIIVIHNSSRYPQLLYLLPDSLLKKVNSKLGIVIPNRGQFKKIKSISDGVICYRIPMFKLIPKNIYSSFRINKQFKEIINILRCEKFSPDVILGHWENPQIQLLPMLKREFKVKTAIVLHSLVYIKQKRYIRWAKKHVKGIDVMGARSKAIASQVKELLSLEKEPFICYSGIDDKYFEYEGFGDADFSKKEPNSYLFVGRLIKRKNVDSTMIALKASYKEKDFSYNIVGQGAEQDRLMSLRESLMLNDNVKFLGYKNRDEVLKIMANTEVFIMISDNETFGLVYIEAMSRGCIVIASKDGGMDGIIVHGNNGFLCEQGNEYELERILEVIKNMTCEEKLKISDNAIQTALNFKDSKVAERYLDSIID